MVLSDISDLKTGGLPYLLVLRMDDCILPLLDQTATKGLLSIAGPTEIPAQPTPFFRGAWIWAIKSVPAASDRARLTLKPLVFVQDWKAIWVAGSTEATD